MKKDWEIKYLNEIANYSIGLTYSPKDIDEDGVVVLRSSNIQNKKVDLSDIVKVTKKIKPELFVKEGDILMCSRNGSQRLVGKTAIIPRLEFPATYGTFMTLIRSDYNNYLYHFFNSDLFKKQIWIGENTMINQVTKYMLDKVNLPIPPLEEQQKIVEKLDKAFELIDQAKANIEQNIINAKELFQSKLDEVFSQKGGGWIEMSLGELGKVSMCKRILKNQTSPEGDIPFYKIGTFGKKPDAYISKELFDEYSSKYSYPNKGQILLSASGTIGRTVVFDGRPSFFQDSNIVWIDNKEEKVLNSYLFHFYKVCNWNPSKGATISRLYNDDLKRIKISFPDIEDQKKLIPIMENLELQTKSLITKYENKLSNLEELRKSILEKAFKGELTN